MKKTFLKIGLFIIGGLLTATLIFCSVYLYKNYPRSAQAFSMGNEKAPIKVLIATQGSDFKDQLTIKLSQKLNSSESYINGIEVSSLKNIDPEEWDKIIIVNSFIVKLNRKVERFINRIDDPNKIMLFVTSGGNDWVPKPGLVVDALTSSSRLEYTDDLVSILKDWALCPSGKKWEPNDYIAALRFHTKVDISRACEDVISKRQKYEVIYPKLESYINALGYYYINIGLAKSAQDIFKLNTDLFPDKANVFDSYAESLFVNGNITLAIKNYEIALELNPDSPTAKEMLNKLKGEKS